MESILDEAEHLNRLVANLLDMTRLEAGVLEAHKEWQSMEEIVGAALIHTTRLLKDHPVVTHVQPEIPFVSMDELLIEQVVINLLENAAKYSPPGTPIEYRILTTLIKYSGKVVTHRQLLKEVWGPDCVSENHYLRVYMNHLRRKIEPEPARPQFVLTDPGIGYRLASDGRL